MGDSHISKLSRTAVATTDDMLRNMTMNTTFYMEGQLSALSRSSLRHLCTRTSDACLCLPGLLPTAQAIRVPMRFHPDCSCLGWVRVRVCVCVVRFGCDVTPPPSYFAPYFPIIFHPHLLFFTPFLCAFCVLISTPLRARRLLRRAAHRPQEVVETLGMSVIDCSWARLDEIPFHQVTSVQTDDRRGLCLNVNVCDYRKQGLRTPLTSSLCA